MKLSNPEQSKRDSKNRVSIKVNSILNIIKTCASILFPLITFPYVSRVLQPTNVGKVNFAQSFVGYFALIAALGLSTYAIRKCAAVKNDREKLSNLASQFFSINLIMTVVAYIALAVTLLLFREFDAYRWLIILESSSILFTSLGTDWLNSAMEDFKFIAIRSVSFQIIALVSMFLFVRTVDDYYIYAIICVVSSSGAYLTNIFYRRKYCSVRFTFKINWKEHISPILFLFVMTLAQVVMSNTDITMLGLMKGDYEVGLYSTAHKVTRIIGQVVQSLAIVVIPRLSIFFSNGDYEKFNALLRKVLNFNITLGLPCFVGVELLANDVVFIAGGEMYLEAIPIIRILMVSFLFSLVGGSFLGNAVLIPTGKEKYYMIVCLITAACNIVLNAILIPHFGGVGAAISTAFNGLLIFVLLLFKLDKNIKIPKIFQVFLGPVVGCVAISLCCCCCYLIEMFWLRVCCAVLTSVLFYSLILLLFKNEFVVGFLDKIKKKVSRSV